MLSTPADNPLVVGLPAPKDTREFVTLELGTDQGLVGIGLTFFGAALTPALKVAVDTLARLLIGDDPTQVEAIAAKLRRLSSGSGPGGIFTWRCRPSTWRAGTSRARPPASRCARCWAGCATARRRTPAGP